LVEVLLMNRMQARRCARSFLRFAWIGCGASLALACSSAIDVGNGGADGGSSSDANGGDAGTTTDAAGTPLTDAAASSLFREKCSLACVAPTTGPCRTADVGACINACTAAVDGLTVGCVQCLTENSGYAGVECVNGPGNPGGTTVFGPHQAGATNACAKGAACAACPCPTCPSQCPCTAAEERCDGFTMEKTSGTLCASQCK
jgi:hypothetical protein